MTFTPFVRTTANPILSIPSHPVTMNMTRPEPAGTSNDNAFVSPFPVLASQSLLFANQQTCPQCHAIASPTNSFTRPTDSFTRRPHFKTLANVGSSPLSSFPLSQSPIPPVKIQTTTAPPKRWSSSPTRTTTKTNAAKKKAKPTTRTDVPVSLPQYTDLSDIDIRQASLAEQRRQYQWHYGAVSDAAFIRHVPDSENPNRRWIVQMKRLEQQCHANVQENAAASTTNKRERFNKHPKNSRQSPTKESTTISTTNDIFAQYKKLFKTIELPDIAVDNAFLRDDVFGWYRVAGPNPMQLCAATPDSLQPFLSAGLTDSALNLITGFNQDTVTQAISDHRFFIADYSNLTALCRDDLPGRKPGKKLYAPIALFCVPDVPDGACVPPLPVGIMHTVDESHNVTWAWSNDEGDEDSWLCAKQMVQVADAFIHETVHHFARTHLLIEAMVCASYRSFDAAHPILALLKSHFEGTAFINSTSLTQLLCKGGTIDRLTAPPIEATRDLAARSLVHDFSFEDAMPDVDMERRGFFNSKDFGFDRGTSKLCFPYRDDALYLWDAILELVRNVLSPYYRSDGDVVGDDQLQNWGRELVWNGHVTGFGETADGGLRTVEYVVRAVAMVIFTASVQHAAVNFPQVSHMQFAPAMPLAGKECSSSSGKNTLIGMMPDIHEAEEQLCAAQMLGVVRYTQLGDYSKGVMERIGGEKALIQFRQKLKQLTRRVADRNEMELKAGLFAYDFLKPQLIPQSINV